MFAEFYRFELRYWLRGIMLYVFLAVITLLFFAATYSDNVQVGGTLGSAYRNAPFVILNLYSAVGILAILMTTAFVDSAASRDFTSHASGILFSKPISKPGYLLGRFLGAATIAVIPTLGVTIGIVLAGWMPGNDPEKWAPINVWAHLSGILVFAIPNTLFFGVVVFSISVLTRSTLLSFVGMLLFLFAYAVGGSFLDDLDNEQLAAMLDPLGSAAMGVITKYWTIDDKNTLTIGLTGLMLANRLLWVAVSCGIFGFAYWRFSFAERAPRRIKVAEQEVPSSNRLIGVSPVAIEHAGFSTERHQFASFLASDFRSVIKNTVFIVIMITGILNMLPNVFFRDTVFYGLSSFPVTYQQVEGIRGSLYIFLIAVIMFFAGVLVWRDRDYRMHEIIGAAPFPNWAAYLSKLLTLLAVVVLMMLAGILLSVVSQATSGYTRFQFGVYFKELLLIDLARMFYLIVLALLMHSLAPNKYVGYFYFVIAIVVNAFVWRILDMEWNLVQFGSLPSYVYSDMYGFAPFTKGLFWFATYWLAFCGILTWVTIQVCHRGIAKSLLDRIRSNRQSVSARSTIIPLVSGMLWIGIGSFLVYNTFFVNHFVSQKVVQEKTAEYEKKYRSLATMPQPRTTSVRYEIDIFPEARNVRMRGVQQIMNKSSNPIEAVYLTLTDNLSYVIELEGGQLSMDDPELHFQKYTMDPPIAPGESREMRFTVETDTKGIENEVTNQQIVQNGSFFNSTIAPHIGYSRNAQLASVDDRRKYGLAAEDPFPSLTRECGLQCMEHYVSSDSDWVSVETVISTSSDQIAVAPGSLEEEWKKDDRNYYRYRLDHTSLNFYSFISARYEVKREQWNGVDIEIYYHPEHLWNVDKMLRSIRESLDYYTKNFGPYQHKQARIIEFPRVSTFAQAFPGTMPYSESIGFIANLEDPEDIDMVFYVVAHEMAHQWWAHQVIGARMEGATLLSESLAQYSALMVMEHALGRDMMRKFLRYEMDTYLRSRGAERTKERPLMEVSPEQTYIHYNKGSVVLYYLKEMIGEERVNAALREIVDRFAYQEPPYPNAHDLVDSFKRHTPEDLQYLITDLFEEITLFSNRVDEATYRKLADGRFEVVLKVTAEKLRADEQGRETVVAMNDFVELGAFAKPEPGKTYGKTLYRERILVEGGPQEFRFITEEIPDRVGIDPFSLLIDRMPNDNVRRPTLVAD